MTPLEGQEPEADAPFYTAPPPRTRRRLSRWLRWPATFLIVSVEGLLILAAVGWTMLAWRAADGPIDISFLLPRVERLVAAADPRLRIAVRSAVIGWQGFGQGPDAPGMVTLQGVKASDAAHRPVLSADEISVNFSVAWASIGVFAPRDIAARNLQLVLRRQSDASLSSISPDVPGRLHQPKPTTLRDVIKVLAQPPGNDRDLVRVRPAELAQLRHVTLQGGLLIVENGPLGATWRAQSINVALVRAAAGGVQGPFSLQLDGADSMSLDPAEQVKRARPGTIGGTLAIDTSRAVTLKASAHVPDPAGLAAGVGRLKDAPLPQAAVSLDTEIDVTPALTLGHFSGRVTLGKGNLLAAGKRVPILGAVVAAHGDRGMVTLDPGSQIALGPVSAAPPPTIGLTGSTDVAPGGKASLGVTIDHVATGDLPIYWPPSLAPGAHDWIAQQTNSGGLHDGDFHFGLTLGKTLDDLALTQSSGAITADGLTVIWLPPIPPMTNVAGTIALDGPDRIKITVSKGQQGKLTVSHSTMVISGLDAAVQPATLAVNVAGPLVDAFALISNPRLHLLGDRPVALSPTAGNIDTHVDLTLPLKDKVLASDVTVKVHAQLTGVALHKLLLGRDLTEGSCTIDANTSQLNVQGHANLATIPLDLTLYSDFRRGPPDQVQTRVNVKGAADTTRLAAAGLPNGGLVRGTVRLAVAATLRRNGRADVDASAAFGEGDLSVAPIGWSGGSKDATLVAHLALQGEKIVALDNIRLTGAGTEATARTTVADGQLASLVIDRLVLGRTNIAGSVNFPVKPGSGYAVAVTGSTLDLSGRFGGAKTTSAAPTNQALSTVSTKQHFARHTPWSVRVQLDRILFGTAPGGASRELDQVRGQAADDGIIMTGANLSLLVPPSGKPARFTVVPAPNGTRRVTLTDDDFGGLLRAINAYDAIAGGNLRIDGTYDDKQADHPLSGKAEMDDFNLHDAPTAARMLQLMTLYGVIDLMRGPGLHFHRMVAPFRLADEQLTLREARAYSASLGLTAEGQIDLPRNHFDIKGTIVPAYFFNSLLGHIPLIGRLFSPEKGGGLFAAAYTLTGSIDSPHVKVNPMSLVTPGFLRGLFDGFHDAPTKTTP
ncbi:MULTISPECIES: AsmA-like C-terminal region-containing protein [unclassified Acidisoma]|uniref:YhdP family protein n=1 Tax=unclassified Acidisoma TaxID=2634065 RepID=UPI00131AB941|nr:MULTISPECIES: AsmA-like C-terminal region-containing protein [unclassified Acidisoma]